MSKIERLDLFRINRQAEKLCKCELPRFEIDTKNRIIRCEICGAILDPFEAFHKVALHFESLDDHCEHLQEIIEKYEKVRYVGRFKEFESEYRKGMLPVCPKCGKAFDFMEIKGFRNKKYFKEVKQMTKIEELEQKLNEASSGFEFVINEIRKELVSYKTQKELKESKKECKWKPTDGEKFWFRNVGGESESYIHEDFFNSSDEWLINNLPIFKTKEECERYWRFMDTVKEKSYSFSKEEWGKHNIRKYTIYYDFNRKEFGVDRSIDIKYLGEIYFKNEADAKYIIDNFSEELKEYWYKGEMKNEI